MYVRSYFVKDSVSICQDTRSHLTVWFVYIYTAGGGGGGGGSGWRRGSVGRESA